VATESSVIEALQPVQDPELHRSVVDLQMVKSVAVNDHLVRVTVAVPTRLDRQRDLAGNTVIEQRAVLQHIPTDQQVQALGRKGRAHSARRVDRDVGTDQFELTWIDVLLCSGVGRRCHHGNVNHR